MRNDRVRVRGYTLLCIFKYLLGEKYITGPLDLGPLTIFFGSDCNFSQVEYFQASRIEIMAPGVAPIIRDYYFKSLELIGQHERVVKVDLFPYISEPRAFGSSIQLLHPNNWYNHHYY